MKFEQILFPTDFSHSSDTGLEFATALARKLGARMIIVHVEEPPVVYGTGEMYYGVPNPDSEALTGMLSAVKPSDPSVPYEHRLVTGDPASEIVRLAEESGADMIVMGTHGRTGLRRMLMGSVAEAVVRRAHCPVLSFKPEDEQSDDA